VNTCFDIRFARHNDIYTELLIRYWLSIRSECCHSDDRTVIHPGEAESVPHVDVAVICVSIHETYPTACTTAGESRRFEHVSEFAIDEVDNFCCCCTRGESADAVFDASVRIHVIYSRLSIRHVADRLTSIYTSCQRGGYAWRVVEHFEDVICSRSSGVGDREFPFCCTAGEGESVAIGKGSCVTYDIYIDVEVSIEIAERRIDGGVRHRIFDRSVQEV